MHLSFEWVRHSEDEGYTSHWFCPQCCQPHTTACGVTTWKTIHRSDCFPQFVKTFLDEDEERHTICRMNLGDPNLIRNFDHSISVNRRGFLEVLALDVDILAGYNILGRDCWQYVDRQWKFRSVLDPLVPKGRNQECQSQDLNPHASKREMGALVLSLSLTGRWLHLTATARPSTFVQLP